MTSPTTRVAPAARTRVRVAAVTAGLAGALALTACGGGGGSDASKSPSPAASSAASSPGASTADAGGGTGGDTGASDGLQGSWLATHDGKAVALVVNGGKAALFATGGTVCSGTAGTEAGMQMIHLTCADSAGKGTKDRETGMVDSAGKTSLEVTWSGKLGKETYTRAEGGKLPSGLATASIGKP